MDSNTTSGVNTSTGSGVGASTGANTSVQGQGNMGLGNAGVGLGATAGSTVNLDSNTVQEIQTSLRDEGYSISTDGIWGPRTAEALRQFQQANGLSATGTVNAETLSALDINR